MLLRFTKMHGLGNDFVVIDAVTQELAMTPDLARRLADRHFGIGCDQVLVVEPPSSPDVDFDYRIYNSDGGEVAQCGNGARCFAKFVRDRRLTGKHQLKVRTRSGVITLLVLPDGQIRVNMGAPRFAPRDIPFAADAEALTYPLEVGGGALEISALSMGNPHAVLVGEDVDSAPVADLGPLIEHHPRFPERVNVGFMAIEGRDRIALRVHERGAGETLACGTGACAAVVAGIRRGLLDNDVKVRLPGGELTIAWAGGDAPVMMTGPATTVFQGRIRI
ncbi:MAG: diaminopimelate epimerase [Porticoccaceae bacterium]|nr:diaminopimelate epimerase [Porticoccaceae bacterium]MEA3299584.1 diaminopimelate epimerase [Pseudomonadota bacterium]HLS97148.1 diaminopimelate epimerase [Porticoccaceae bacterium]